MSMQLLNLLNNSNCVKVYGVEEDKVKNPLGQLARVSVNANHV